MKLNDSQIQNSPNNELPLIGKSIISDINVFQTDCKYDMNDLNRSIIYYMKINVVKWKNYFG